MSRIEIRGEVETTMKTIVIKMQSINALNEAILNDIAEDELEEGTIRHNSKLKYRKKWTNLEKFY